MVSSLGNRAPDIRRQSGFGEVSPHPFTEADASSYEDSGLVPALSAKTRDRRPVPFGLELRDGSSPSRGGFVAQIAGVEDIGERE